MRKLYQNLTTALIFIALTIIIILLIIKYDSSDSKKVQAVAVGFPVTSSNHPTDGPTLLYSYDGLTWNESSGSSFNYKITDGHYMGAGVGFGNNKWIATGWNRNTDKNILYSNDGINWKEANRSDGSSIFYNGPADTTQLRGNNVAYGNNRWVAVGKDETDKNILYSDDGISWFLAAMTTPGLSTFPGVSHLDGGKAVAYGNNRWVAVGKGEGNVGNILYSDNGISWDSSHMAGGASPFIAWYNSAGLGVFYNTSTNLWLATGRADNDDNLLVSSDGICWEVRSALLEGSSFFTRGCYDIIYSSEKNAFIATGSNGFGASGDQNLAFSNNSITWTASVLSNGISYPFKDDVNGLAVNYSNNLDLWFATGGNDIGVNSGTILNSSNGISWNTTIMSNGISYPFGTGPDAVAYDIAVRN